MYHVTIRLHLTRVELMDFIDRGGQRVKGTESEQVLRKFSLSPLNCFISSLSVCDLAYPFHSVAGIHWAAPFALGIF